MIIPNHRSEATLPRALRSLEAAARGCELETVIQDDPDGRGPAWARNRALERLSGEYVFFLDADDTVETGFIDRPLAALQSSGADICLFDFAGAPLKRDYDLTGNAAVRSALLPAFFGYSFDDVRRWNAGGPLSLNRELGYVWRAAFRAGFLRRHRIYFDETLPVNEDAAFLSQCAIYAERVVSVRENLYRYRHSPDGLSSRARNSRRHWEYKFAALEFRKRLVASAGSETGRYCEASHVFSAMEMLRLRRASELSPAAFLRQIRAYVSDPAVYEALCRFPLSIRHPAAAGAVAFLRMIGM